MLDWSGRSAQIFKRLCTIFFFAQFFFAKTSLIAEAKTDRAGPVGSSVNSAAYHVESVGLHLSDGASGRRVLADDVQLDELVEFNHCFRVSSDRLNIGTL